MSSSHVVHHHETHGNHPMAVVGFVLVLAGFGCAAMWLIALALGHTAGAVSFGIAAAVVMLVGVTVIATLTRRLHHSPFVPDNTNAEARRYLEEYRG